VGRGKVLKVVENVTLIRCRGREPMAANAHNPDEEGKIGRKR